MATDIIVQAQAFMGKAKDMTREALNEAVKALPESVRSAYRDLRKASYYAPENEKIESRTEHLSPDGQYKLVVGYFGTGPGSWNYSQGMIYRLGSNNPIAVVRRNYSAFPYAWVAHQNGHPYLICGEDYQGQTVIELDTGARRDLLSDGSDKGWGFCWAAYTYDAPNQLLVVCGCHWACPYEHRFFDFSNPMSGWPEVEPDEPVDADERKEPELDPDGTMRAFMTRYTDDDDDEEETDEEKAKKPKDPIVDVIRTYRRDSLKFKLIEEWASDYEKDRRIKREEWERKDKEWTANFKATDPLYLAYAELVNDPALSPADHTGVGQTYDDWAKGSDWSGKERRWCRRIVTHKGKTGPTVDLEWAVDTGPIKLVFYRDGKSDGHKFFEHSVEGMKSAFAAAKEYAHDVM
jgi:hypothetical protein